MTMTLKAKALSSALFTPEHLGRKKAAKPAVMGWKYVEGNEKRKALDSTSDLLFFFFFLTDALLTFRNRKVNSTTKKKVNPYENMEIKEGRLVVLGTA